MNKVGFSDVEASVIKAQNNLMNAQRAIRKHTDDADPITREKETKADLRRAKKSICYVFYQAIKARRHHYKIHPIHDRSGVWITRKERVDEAFLNFLH